MKVVKSKNWGEIIRFCIVGVSMTLLHYGIYLFLKRWIYINLAYSIGYGLSLICNYFLTSYFTFRTKVTALRGIGFGVAHLFNYFFQIFLLNIFLLGGIRQNLAPLPVYMVAVPVQFMMIRFVFKQWTKN